MILTEMNGGEFHFPDAGGWPCARKHVLTFAAFFRKPLRCGGGDQSRTQSSHSTRPFGGGSHPTNSEYFRVIPSISDRRATSQVPCAQQHFPPKFVEICVNSRTQKPRLQPLIRFVLRLLSILAENHPKCLCMNTLHIEWSFPARASIVPNRA
jgi:hypothetical protein